tara:strand:- start:1413 stop:2768 length:1356 start_codon:yes stop_codon:yes gene_type:complete
MKFGGSILSSKEDLQRIAKLVKKRREAGEEICMVVSALKGTTDSLINASESALDTEKSIEKFVSEIRKKHLDLVGQLDNDEAQEKGAKKVKEKLEILERALYGINYLGELSERSKALVYTMGERLSSLLVEAYLNQGGVKAVAMDAGDAGIVTDCCYATANPLMDKTRERVKAGLDKRLAEEVVVVTGYFGIDENGNITCLGRGGSDFSAGILANALDADALELWKDVDGFMSADPKAVEDAKLLKSLSYSEAEELGYLGAKILHPRTIVPLREKNIKAVVKNILKPGQEGTVISSFKEEKENIVKSIAIQKNIAVVQLKSASIVGLPGALTQIFSALSTNEINVDLVSTSEAGVSLTIGQTDVEKARNALENCPLAFESIAFDEDVAMIGIIGEGMKGKTGITGKIFGALGDAEINIEMISQGSTEINLSIVVKEHDAEKAVKVIHKKFT